MGLKCIVTGGLGYIGSVVSKMLMERGHEVLIVDDGRDSVAHGVFDPKMVIRQSIGHVHHRLLTAFEPDVVLHFAAYGALRAGEENLGGYLENNVQELQVFLQELALTDCQAFINSGTCAVYAPSHEPIDEGRPERPDSWYGWTKLIAEEYLVRWASRQPMEVLRFRFFNVAGSGYGIAEKRRVEEHLIPKALDAAALGHPFNLYGSDYPTQDGTCVRDFVHVLDLAKAHVVAAEKLAAGVQLPPIINLGSGAGYSVAQVLTVVEEVAGVKLRVLQNARRRGDSPVRVADTRLAEQVLDWKAERRLKQMVEDAWRARSGS
jgi:UDP-glucose 4-epimerase